MAYEDALEVRMPYEDALELRMPLGCPGGEDGMPWRLGCPEYALEVRMPYEDAPEMRIPLGCPGGEGALRMPWRWGCPMRMPWRLGCPEDVLQVKMPWRWGWYVMMPCEYSMEQKRWPSGLNKIKVMADPDLSARRPWNDCAFQAHILGWMALPQFTTIHNPSSSSSQLHFLPGLIMVMD